MADLQFYFPTLSHKQRGKNIFGSHQFCKVPHLKIVGVCNFHRRYTTTERQNVKKYSKINGTISKDFFWYNGCTK